MRILEEFEETGSISEKIEAACEIANKQIGDEFFDVSDMKVRIPENFIPDIRPTLERIDSNYIPRKTWFGGENEKSRFSVTSISDNDKIEFCHFNKLSLNQETDDYDKFEKEGIIASIYPTFDRSTYNLNKKLVKGEIVHWVVSDDAPAKKIANILMEIYKELSAAENTSGFKNGLFYSVSKNEAFVKENEKLLEAYRKFKRITK
jgi:phosphoribosyl-AMP cyclohydrolase